jgi:hypothetical protein
MTIIEGDKSSHILPGLMLSNTVAAARKFVRLPMDCFEKMMKRSSGKNDLESLLSAQMDDETGASAKG